jgi:hypothetical protein
MAIITGKEREYDITLNGIPYTVLRQNGRPVWSSQQVIKIQGQQTGQQLEELRFDTFDKGFGYGQHWTNGGYHYTTAMDGRFAKQLTMGPLVNSITLAAGTETVVRLVELGSYIFAYGGRYINQIDPADDSINDTSAVFPYDCGAGYAVTDADYFDGYVYVFLSSAHNILRHTGVASPTQASDTVQGHQAARYWADTYYALAKAQSESGTPKVAWCSQGTAPFTAANWVTAYTVGETTSSITALAGLERTLYVAKSDGLYYIDKTGRTPCLIPASPISTYNGVNTWVDSSGRVWYPTLSGLFVYESDTGSILNATPGNKLPNTSSIYGRITAMAQWRGWYYAAIYNGTDTFLMCGRERQDGEEGFGPIIWHGALATFASTTCNCMLVSASTTPPRLWMGVGTGVRYIKLPTNGDNPLQDSNYAYAYTGTPYSTVTGSIYFGHSDWGATGTKWNLQDIFIDIETMPTNSSVLVYYKLDAANWAQAGSTITTAGRHEIALTTDLRFNRCALRVDVVNAASTSSVTIRSVVGRAVRKTEVVDQIQTTVLLGDELSSRFNTPVRKDAASLAALLKALPEAGPVVLEDWWTGAKRSQTVNVLPVTETLYSHPEKSTEPAQAVVNLTLQVVG